MISTHETQSLMSQTADLLASHGAPAISSYELAKHVFLLGQRSKEQALALKTVFSRLREELLRVRLLSPIEPVAETRGYLLFGKANANPSEIICGLDPFAYVSHLSAMEYHGLTDRFSKILYMTRPGQVAWREQGLARMRKDFGLEFDAYVDSGLPKLIQPKISRLGQTTMHFCERSQLGAFRRVAGSSLRVSTVGRVFLEMIREPSLCGGIQHVIDVYQSEAKRNLKLIVNEMNQHGSAIDKVRAGYLLSEVCGLNDPSFTDWEKFAQRGGSRMLDPQGEYVSHFSERWKLSLNVPSVIQQGEDE